METITVRFSASYMSDHLDMWPNDLNCLEPVGIFKGNYWLGDVTPTQLREILSRSDCYASMKGTCDYQENRRYVDGAIRVIDAAKAMGYTYSYKRGEGLLLKNGEVIPTLEEKKPYRPKTKGVSQLGYWMDGKWYPSTKAVA